VKIVRVLFFKIMRNVKGQSNDFIFMQNAVDLARKAEYHGNLPIGAVIILENKIIAEGFNSIIVPEYNPANHAEMIALDKIPVELWSRAREMTCYTTLEPCCMCFGRLLLSEVGRIVFGAYDPEGGAGCLINHLPKFYTKKNIPLWEGPLMPDICDTLFNKSLLLFLKRVK
jgi:tRNA(adenine34) deaminase